MKITFKTLTGRECTIDDVQPDTTVRDLKTKVQSKEGIPPAYQKLIFGGQELLDHRTLEFYNIQEGSEGHLITNLRGMISTFTSTDTSNLSTAFLMLSDEDRGNTEVPLDALKEAARQCKADKFMAFAFDKDPGILNLSHRELLCRFLDFLWATTPASAPRVDMKAVLSDTLFEDLLGRLLGSTGDHTSVLDKLKASFNEMSPGDAPESKIALRMTKGPTNACIAFHCDGGYATATCQIALNEPSEYKGGKLCFFVSDTLFVLDRTAGSLSQHRPAVLHGVTTLTEGTRKSLFVVDRTNGLGDEDVLEVTQQHITDFVQYIPTLPSE